MKFKSLTIRNFIKHKHFLSDFMVVICLLRWEAGSVIHLAAMFRDVPLTSEELRFVIEKIVRLFRDVEMSDMPALVYQLLLLSTKVCCFVMQECNFDYI